MEVQNNKGQEWYGIENYEQTVIFTEIIQGLRFGRWLTNGENGLNRKITEANLKRFFDKNLF